MTIEQNVTELVALGVKPERIAVACDVSRSTVQRWLDGESEPHKFIKRKIAGMLKAKRMESCQ